MGVVCERKGRGDTQSFFRALQLNSSKEQKEKKYSMFMAAGGNGCQRALWTESGRINSDHVSRYVGYKRFA